MIFHCINNLVSNGNIKSKIVMVQTLISAPTSLPVERGLNIKGIYRLSGGVTKKKVFLFENYSFLLSTL